MKIILDTLSKYDKIIFVGGGSGGHISPIIAIHRAMSPSSKNFIWIGGKNSTEEQHARESKIPFFGITVLKLSTTRSPKVLLYPFFLIKSIIDAIFILKKQKEQNHNLAIFSKGGPGALAIGIAGKIVGIPLYIHETDTIPGRSNLRLGKLANAVFLGFESTKKFFDSKKTLVTGQIIDPLLHEDNTKQKLFWKTHKKHILVLCGSQGAKRVFEEIAQNCKNIDAEWIIVLGTLNSNMRGQFDGFGNIQVIDWLEKTEQRHIFEKTDLAITRGSATILAELDIFHIPKIIIPLPTSASNHQYYNALEYEKKGDTLLEQKNIQKLKKILQEKL